MRVLKINLLLYVTLIIKYLITSVIKSQKCKYKEDYCTEYKLINVFQIKNTLNNCVEERSF